MFEMKWHAMACTAQLNESWMKGQVLKKNRIKHDTNITNVALANESCDSLFSAFFSFGITFTSNESIQISSETIYFTWFCDWFKYHIDLI